MIKKDQEAHNIKNEHFVVSLEIEIVLGFLVFDLDKFNNNFI